MQYFEIDDTKTFMSALFGGESFKDFELSSLQITTFMTFQIDGLLHSDFFREGRLPEALAQEGENAQNAALEYKAGSGDVQAAERDNEKVRKVPSGQDEMQGKNDRLTPWPLAAPVVVSLIRGKRPPLSMKLVLRLSDAHALRLTSGAGTPFPFSDIKGLFLNISYAEGKVSCTTGTSLNVFTLDKTLDHVWDEAVGKFLRMM